MKKIFLILAILLATYKIAKSEEIYHNINIDKVYTSTDWSSKEEIRKLIDDYTLLLEYQKEFESCSTELTDISNCYDTIAEKVLTNLYMERDTNLNQYNQFKEIISKLYGLKNCRNKYDWPSGNICEKKTNSDTLAMIKKYIQDLLDDSKEKMFSYSTILKEYK